MKSCNSDNNKNVSSVVEQRANRVAFCSKGVWGTPEGVMMYRYTQKL